MLHDIRRQFGCPSTAIGRREQHATSYESIRACVRTRGDQGSGVTRSRDTADL